MDKYNEALEKAKSALANTESAVTAGILRDIFPELKESEDERIRKTLKEYFINSFQNNGVAAILGVHIKDIFAWLEKQGKTKSYSWKPSEEQLEALDYAYNSCPDTERGNYYEGVLETLIEDLHILEKQGEQKPVEWAINFFNMEEEKRNAYIKALEKIEYLDKSPSFNEGWDAAIEFARRHTEIQNSIEWSEEDHSMKHFAYCRIYEYEKKANALPVAEEARKCMKWLDSLEDRYVLQPQQEWSEEDEEMRNNLIGLLVRLSANSRTDSTSPNYCYPREISWLKSLRPQKQWKPSEEQIMYLSEAIDIVEKAEKFSVVSALKELKERLKAL